MGRKLDLTGMSDNEVAHVLQVVQRDMRLRKKEEERLSELKQELDEEGSRCLLLSRQACFNQRCCIRCCSPFTFLLNPKRQCRDCSYNVCKACRVYNKQDKAWLCSACQKSRLLKTQSLEWFYTNVKKRFKRFGSAKVLKTLYRKHLAEHSALAELTEGSACEESICNEGSICGSDSTFYRQSEEHSMAETLSVAMRVAEEAIDEAISKAEFDTSTQDKWNEAHYLREHRGELIEELAKTIVDKIISRRKTLAKMQAEYEHDWSHDTDLHHEPACDQTSSMLKHQQHLWRSHSAFTLLDDDDDDDDPPALTQESPLALKKEGAGSALTAWKSVDRLDNSGVSSVLKSPDGNWIALQSAQLSRPSLLTKRKSLVYSALERESGVVSAYEGLGSDNETKPEPDGSWGAVLQEIHRKMTDSNFNLHEFGDSPSPHMGQQGSRENPDTEANWKPNKHILALLKRKVPAEIRKPSSSRRTSIIDVNFNLKGDGEEEVNIAAKADVEKARKSRKRRKKKSEKEPESSSPVSDLNQKDRCPHPSESMTPDTLTSGGTTPEHVDPHGDITGDGANRINEELTLRLHQLTGNAPDSWMQGGERGKGGGGGDDGEEEEKRQGSRNRDDEDERRFKMDIDWEGGRTKDEEETERDDEEMRYRLYRLVAQSSLTYFSSTEDELDRLGQSEGELDKDEDMEEDNEEQEEKTEPLTYRLCQLEKEVRQFSSTEDELDRFGEEEEDGKDEDLAVKVCRLVNQVSAAQFSSTEDELDRVGRDDGEEVADEEILWELQPEKSRLRDLASLVSASQFSSTEDELDKIEENEANKDKIGNLKAKMLEGAESMEDIDMKMFDLKVETEARNDDEEGSENVLESQGTGVHVEHHEAVIKEFLDKKMAEDLKTANEQVETSKAEKGEEPEKRRETRLKTKVEAKGTEEIRVLHENKEEQNEPRASGPHEREAKFVKESSEIPRRWGTAADSEEEDNTEFDRIISSMLMMTLEDMQVETMKDGAGTNSGRNRQMKNNSQRGESRTTADAQITDASEDTQDVLHEENEGETCGKQESRDMTDSNENVQEENCPEMGIRETPKTNETQLTCRETELFNEKLDGRGGVMAEGEAVEMQGETAGCQSTGVDDKHEKRKEENADGIEQSGTSTPREGFLSPEQIQNARDVELYQTIDLISSLLQQRYSAVSLRNITTEVLKVLNATEDLLQGVEGEDDVRISSISLPPDMDPKKLDQQFCKLEENVYMAAGSVYSLEVELSDLEECARGICSSTSDMELSFLEEQVAAAAAKVHQSELQIGDISARIAALKSAGLNVDPQTRFTKTKTQPDVFVTLDSSKQQRRRLPAPPVKENKES